MNPEWLIASFTRNNYVIQRLTDGLTHADSLLTPAAGGNCANWILGHVLVSRNHLLELLGASPVWDAVTRTRYVTGSEPVGGADESAVLPLERLLADISSTGQAISAALQSMHNADLLAEVEGSTLGETIMGLCWHETYHIGQLEPLRRLAGKTEKVFG